MMPNQNRVSYTSEWDKDVIFLDAIAYLLNKNNLPYFLSKHLLFSSHFPETLHYYAACFIATAVLKISPVTYK